MSGRFDSGGGGGGGSGSGTSSDDTASATDDDSRTQDRDLNPDDPLFGGNEGSSTDSSSNGSTTGGGASSSSTTSTTSQSSSTDDGQNAPTGGSPQVEAPSGDTREIGGTDSGFDPQQTTSGQTQEQETNTQRRAATTQEEEPRSIEEYQPGVDPGVRDAASELEQEFISSTPGVDDPEEVRVVWADRDEGRIQTELTREGERAYAEEQVQEQTGLPTASFDLERTEGGDFEVDLVEQDVPEPEDPAVGSGGVVEIPDGEAIGPISRPGAGESNVDPAPGEAGEPVLPGAGDEPLAPVSRPEAGEADTNAAPGDPGERTMSDSEGRFAPVDRFRSPGNFDVETQEEDTSTTAGEQEQQREELFGDFDWSFGLGDPEEDEVEQFIDEEIGEDGSEFLSQYTDPLQEPARERLDEPVGDATSGSLYNPNSRFSAAAAYEAANLIEGLPRVPGDLLEIAETTGYVTSNAFGVGLAAQEEDREEARQNLQEVEAVAGQTLGRGVDFAETNPMRTGAILGLVAGGEIVAERAAARGARAAGRSARAATTSDAPSSSSTLDLRSAAARARERSPSVDISTRPDSPTLSFDPDVRRQLVETFTPSGRSGRTDLGRPLRTDLDEPSFRSRLPDVRSRLPSGSSRQRGALGRPLPSTVGERGVTERAVDALTTDADGTVLVDDSGRAFTARNPLGRPLSTDLGETALSNRALEAMRTARAGSEATEDSARVFVPRNPLGRPLPASVGETAVSQRLMNAFSTSGGRTDLGRPLPLSAGETPISQQITGLLSGTTTRFGSRTAGRTGLGRPLPSTVGERGFSERAVDFLSSDVDGEATVFVSDEGEVFTARNPLGGPLANDVDDTSVTEFFAENRVRDLSIEVSPGAGFRGTADDADLDAEPVSGGRFDTDIFDSSDDADTPPTRDGADSDSREVDVDADQQGRDGTQQLVTQRRLEDDSPDTSTREVPERRERDAPTTPRAQPLGAGTAPLLTPVDAVGSSSSETTTESTLPGVGPTFEEDVGLGMIAGQTPEEELEPGQVGRVPERVGYPPRDDTEVFVAEVTTPGLVREPEQVAEPEPEPEPRPEPGRRPEPFPSLGGGGAGDEDEDFLYTGVSEEFEVGFLTPVGDPVPMGGLFE